MTTTTTKMPAFTQTWTTSELDSRTSLACPSWCELVADAHELAVVEHDRRHVPTWDHSRRIAAGVMVLQATFLVSDLGGSWRVESDAATIVLELEGEFAVADARALVGHLTAAVVLVEGADA